MKGDEKRGKLIRKMPEKKNSDREEMKRDLGRKTGKREPGFQKIRKEREN